MPSKSLSSCLENFWKQKGFLNYILLPFSWVYSGVAYIRYFLASPKKVNAKVICVGNAVVGGSGKTPTCIALAKKYKKVAFISRGYKGSLSNSRKPVRVDLKKHSFLEVGDEPMLLAEVAPTYICPNRYLAAQMAVKDGAKVLIMDDGLQNYTLYKDETYLIQSHKTNGFVLPAGNLREPKSLALKKARVLKIEFHVKNPKQFKGKHCIAVASIANPERFFTSLKSTGAKVIKEINFPDHHVYKEAELKQLVELARVKKCDLITTTKDYVKLGKFKRNFKTLEIEID